MSDEVGITQDQEEFHLSAKVILFGKKHLWVFSIPVGVSEIQFDSLKRQIREWSECLENWAKLDNPEPNMMFLISGNIDVTIESVEEK